MKPKGSICECGHWSDRHHEEWNEKTHESFWKCKACDCDDFRADAAMMRELENEAKQRKYHERTDK